MTNQLLLEAGSARTGASGAARSSPAATSTQSRPRDRAVHGAAARNNGNIPNLHVPVGHWSRTTGRARVTWRASASYVTGAQSMKFGYQGGYLVDNQNTYTNNQFLAYRFNNGVPNQITENINAVPSQAARALRRVLRAGTVDARPDDAAGRAALRPRVELLPRASRSARSASCRRPINYPETRGRRRATTTSRRAAASRTTCSATARRRSRSTSASISRRRRTAWRTRALRPSSRLQGTTTRDLDRHEPQLHSRLRSAESRRQRRVPARSPTRRSGRTSSPATSIPRSQRLGRASGRLGLRRLGPAGNAARVSRSKSATTAGG